jgi:chromosome segregation ATPase/DNA-directed RNA polymerase subunit RPC12/RpoP
VNRGDRRADRPLERRTIMVEYLQISCPSCQRTLRVRKQYAGREVACSHCGQSFVVQQPDEPHESAMHPVRHHPQAISEAERESYEKQVADLADELQKVRADHQKIASELAVVTEQVQRRDAERDQLGNQVKELTAQLEQLREQAQVDAVLRDELADSQAELEQLRAQIQSLESRVAAADRLEQELKIENVQRDRLNEQLQKLSEEVVAVRVERDRLADQDTTHTAELEQLHTSLEQFRQESTSLRQERDRHAQEANQAHARNSELAEKIRTLESKLAQPTTSLDVPADQRPLEELRSQVLKLQIQNEELRSVIHGLGITVG